MAENALGITEIENQEHISQQKTGDNIAAKRVAVYEWNGEEWQRSGLPVETRYDYSGNPIYIANASIGADETASVWTIQAYDLSDSSNATAKIATNTAWSNRASGTYT
jgi:hypothetical protein